MKRTSSAALRITMDEEIVQISDRSGRSLGSLRLVLEGGRVSSVSETWAQHGAARGKLLSAFARVAQQDRDALASHPNGGRPALVTGTIDLERADLLLGAPGATMDKVAVQLGVSKSSLTRARRARDERVRSRQPQEAAPDSGPQASPIPASSPTPAAPLPPSPPTDGERLRAAMTAKGIGQWALVHQLLGPDAHRSTVGNVILGKARLSTAGGGALLAWVESVEAETGTAPCAPSPLALIAIEPPCAPLPIPGRVLALPERRHIPGRAACIVEGCGGSVEGDAALCPLCDRIVTCAAGLVQKHPRPRADLIAAVELQHGASLKEPNPALRYRRIHMAIMEGGRIGRLGFHLEMNAITVPGWVPKKGRKGARR